MKRRKRSLFIAAFAALALIVAGAAAGSLLYRAYPIQVSLFAALTRNYIRSWGASPGTTTTEQNPAYKDAAPAPARSVVTAPNAGGDDWPNYNRTLTSERYSPLAEINTKTVPKLKIQCTYDTKQYTSFESGLIMVNGALIGTTLSDIFSINPATCEENWRTRQNLPASILTAMRGAAYLDGKLFRGSQDGRVLAYDFKTGRPIWQTTIGSASKGEFVAAAPIAWNGLVYIGNAGGDGKGGKGRMYALDAESGKIMWEFYLVPKTEGDLPRGPEGPSPLDASTWGNGPGFPIGGGATWASYTLDPVARELYVPVGNPSPAYAISVREGDNLYTDSIVVLDAMSGAYKRHFKLVPRDWHDWDVASAPALIHTQGGKRLLSAAPKDGHLYGIDLADNTIVYRTPVTKIENVEAAFATDKAVRFCPGNGGGSEWNGPAYDPITNLIITGEVDWCTTVKRQTDEQLQDAPTGGAWFGNAMRNPFNLFAKPIDIVILGSSHAQLGLSAAAVEDQLALHGKRASVANLAIGGPGQNIQWAIVDQLFKSKSPKVIVIGVDDQPQLFGHFAFRYVAPAGAVVFPPTPFLHNYLYDLAYLPARKAQLFGAELFPTLFGLPKQFDPKAYAGKRSDYTTDFPDEFGKTVDMMHPVSRATLLAQQRRPDGRTFVARALNRISGGEDHLYIQKIAEKARAHGTQLIFIYIPIFNGPATISDRAFLEQYGQVLNLGDLAQRDELFENWGHFNHAGAMTASARLADAIAGLDF